MRLFYCIILLNRQQNKMGFEIKWGFSKISLRSAISLFTQWARHVKKRKLMAKSVKTQLSTYKYKCLFMNENDKKIMESA